MNGAVSRRSFMKIAGIGAASLAVLESLPAWAAKLPVVSSPVLGINDLAWSGWIRAHDTTALCQSGFWQARFRDGVKSAWRVQYFAVNATLPYVIFGDAPSREAMEVQLRNAVLTAEQIMRDYVRGGTAMEFKVYGDDGRETWQPVGCVEWMIGDRLLHPVMEDPFAMRGAKREMKAANPEMAAMLPASAAPIEAREIVGDRSPFFAARDRRAAERMAALAKMESEAKERLRRRRERQSSFLEYLRVDTAVQRGVDKVLS